MATKSENNSQEIYQKKNCWVSGLHRLYTSLNDIKNGVIKSQYRDYISADYTVIYVKCDALDASIFGSDYKTGTSWIISHKTVFGGNVKLSDIESLSNDISDNTESIEILDASLNELSEHVSNHDTSISVLDSSVNFIDSSVSSLISNLSDLSEDVSDIELSIQNIDFSVGTNKDDIFVLKTEVFGNIQFIDSSTSSNVIARRYENGDITDTYVYNAYITNDENVCYVISGSETTEDASVYTHTEDVLAPWQDIGTLQSVKYSLQKQITDAVTNIMSRIDEVQDIAYAGL